MGTTIKIAGKIICLFISATEIVKEIKRATASEKGGE